MVKVITTEAADWRVEIKKLEGVGSKRKITGVRLISLKDHHYLNVDEMKDILQPKIIEALEELDEKNRKQYKHQ